MQRAQSPDAFKTQELIPSNPGATVAPVHHPMIEVPALVAHPDHGSPEGLDAEMLEPQLQQQVLQLDQTFSIFAAQVAWDGAFITALRQGRPLADLQAKAEQVLELSVLLNHPGLLRIQDSSPLNPGIWRSVRQWLETRNFHIRAKLAQALEEQSGAQTTFTSTAVLHIVHLWETLLPSMWDLRQAELVESQRWSDAILHMDTLLLVLQLNIHGVFGLSDRALLSLLKPTFNKIIPTPKVFVDTLNQRYQADDKVRLLIRLFSEEMNTPTHHASASLPVSSSHLDPFSLGSSDLESCSQSESESLYESIQEQFWLYTINTMANFEQLMSDVGMEQRVDLLRHIKNYLVLIIYNVDDVRCLLNLFPAQYWSDILFDIRTKYNTLLSTNAEHALLLQDIFNKMPGLHMTSVTQPVSSSSSMFVASHQSNTTSISFGVDLLSEPQDFSRLTHFIKELFNQKTDKDVDEILSLLPEDYYRPLVTLLYGDMPHCGAKGLVKLFNYFQGNVRFIFHAFCQDVFLQMLTAGSVAVILNSIYLRNAVIFISYINDLMGDRVGNIFADMALLKQTLPLLGSHKLDFIRSIKNCMSDVFLRTDQKNLYLTQLLNMVEQVDKPYIIELFSDILPHLFSCRYTIAPTPSSSSDVYPASELTSRRVVALTPGVSETRMTGAHKGVNATAYASALKVLPVDFYCRFTWLIKDTLPSIFETKEDVMIATRIIPQAYRLHFLSIDMIQERIKQLCNLTSQPIRRLTADAGKFFAMLLSTLPLEDIAKASNLLINKTYHTWIAVALKTYKEAKDSKQTTIRMPTKALGFFSFESSMEIQPFDIHTRPSESLLLLLDKFKDEMRHRSSPAGEARQEIASGMMEQLYEKMPSTFNSAIALLSEAVHQSLPTSMPLLALVHVIQSATPKTSSPKPTIQLNLPETIPLQALSNRSLLDNQQQFCIDIKRCSLVVIREGSVETVLIDSCSQGNTFVELDNAAIINIIETSHIPESYRSLIYQCTQHQYASRIINVFINLFDTMDMCLSIVRRYKHAKQNTRAIKFNRFEETVELEEVYYGNAWGMKQEEPKELDTVAYIKTRQTFDVAGRYCREPAVTLSLPDVVLQKITEFCEEKLRKGEDLTALEQYMLSVLKPRGAPEVTIASDGTTTFFTPSSPSSTPMPSTGVSTSREHSGPLI